MSAYLTTTGWARRNRASRMDSGIVLFCTVCSAADFVILLLLVLLLLLLLCLGWFNWPTFCSSSSSSSSSRTYRLTWHKLNTIASRTQYRNDREKN